MLSSLLPPTEVEGEVVGDGRGTDSETRGCAYFLANTRFRRADIGSTPTTMDLSFTTYSHRARETHFLSVTTVYEVQDVLSAVTVVAGNPSRWPSHSDTIFSASSRDDNGGTHMMIRSVTYTKSKLVAVSWSMNRAFLPDTISRR